QRTAPPPAKPAEVLDVKLHVRQHAQVTVDDRDLGDSTLFSLKLTPGPHRVLVRHPCCEDNSQLLTVTKTQPGQMYKLDYGPAQPPAGAESRGAIAALNRARVTFEYCDYAQASKLLAALLEAGRFDSLQMRAEAYRLLGLSLFYQGRKGEAYSAFLEYLYINPDAELDPFYVPPAAVAFFNQVKKEAEPRLAPLRAQKRAEQDAQKKAAAQEADRRRQRELEEERKRLQQIS